MPSALVVLANGFEEIEATAIIDILRRGNIDVTLAGLDASDITGAHQLSVTTETTLSQALESAFDAIVLPGGEPGTTNLQNSELLKRALYDFAAANKVVAAICAAPRILDALGLLDGKRATSYPGTKPDMTRCTYSEDAVVVDGAIITSRGPGTAMAFAYALLEFLQSSETSQELKEAMIFS
jgi:4-methyl-5(b-hydroxyethyl)-thiazole monophosphate biosynthesis